MNALRTCACLLATVALAGCATTSHSSHVSHTSHASHPNTAASTSQHVPVTGHLTGRFVMEGGPLGPEGQQPGERPLPGLVTVTAAGARPVTIRVGASGRFSAWLPPGRYQVSGRSPDIEEATTAQVGNASPQGQELPCSQPLTVTVTALHTTTVTLACIVP
jgi:hypothetical protein